MSLDRELPPLAIDPDFFSAALQAGALDDWLDYARRAGTDDRSHADLNRRLAEALFHCERGEEALECGRRALAVAAGDPETLHFAAWLFSNSGCHGEAAAAYRRLLERYPDWTDGYRHASGSLAAVGALEDAIDYALEACARAPDDPEVAIHAAELLIRCDRAQEAAELLRRTALCDPRNPQPLRVLSAAEMVRGAFEAALAAIDARFNSRLRQPSITCTAGICWQHLASWPRRKRHSIPPPGSTRQTPSASARKSISICGKAE